MASARQSATAATAAAAANVRPVLRAVEQSRPSTVCRVHSCLRCRAAIESPEPCSFVTTAASVCRLCRSQEQVISHMPQARSTWAAQLASLRRGA
jgi:hypothetical protein